MTRRARHLCEKADGYFGTCPQCEAEAEAGPFVIRNGWRFLSEGLTWSPNGEYAELFLTRESANVELDILGSVFVYARIERAPRLSPAPVYLPPLRGRDG